MEYLKDPEIQKLINKPAMASVEEIATLARKRGIDDPRLFWDLFDAIRKLHVEKKCFDGD